KNVDADRPVRNVLSAALSLPRVLDHRLLGVDFERVGTHPVLRQGMLRKSRMQGPVHPNDIAVEPALEVVEQAGPNRRRISGPDRFVDRLSGPGQFRRHRRCLRVAFFPGEPISCKMTPTLRSADWSGSADSVTPRRISSSAPRNGVPMSAPTSSAV